MFLYVHTQTNSATNRHGRTTLQEENLRKYIEALRADIETLWQNKDEPGVIEKLRAHTHDPKEKTPTCVERVINMLDAGVLRVAHPPREHGGDWIVDAWVKQAILLYFKTAKMTITEVGPFEWNDKIPLKKGFEHLGVRVVPPAVVRFGGYVQSGAVLMPSYVNIGAWVGSGSMIDTWATVGSCAQIGCNVHISGGVGIGGVLEPASATPVIIEDGAFIGSRCIVVEGVRVGREAVLGAGVVLTSSSKIIDVSGPGLPKELKGYIPPRSVVIPGMTERNFPAGKFHVPCAFIIGQRKESTDRKTSLEQALREFGVSA